MCRTSEKAIVWPLKEIYWNQGQKQEHFFFFFFFLVLHCLTKHDGNITSWTWRAPYWFGMRTQFESLNFPVLWTFGAHLCCHLYKLLHHAYFYRNQAFTHLFKLQPVGLSLLLFVVWYLIKSFNWDIAWRYSLQSTVI